MPKERYYEIMAGPVKAGQSGSVDHFGSPGPDRPMAEFLCREERMDGESFRAELCQAA